MNSQLQAARPFAVFQPLMWVWAGIILGLSFIATPAKFLAPSLSLAEALDVGRATFGVFKTIEAGLLLLALALLLAESVRCAKSHVALVVKPIAAPLLTLSILLSVQYLWLLPTLDTRVELIFQGTTPPPSMLHHAYVGVELAKILCLILLGRQASNSGIALPHKEVL